MAKVTILQLLDPLKVFVEYETQYEIYVAQCLQTGHLVTADDANTAKEMIKELLQDEVSLAVKNNDIRLLSNPAPMLLWVKFELAEKTNGADTDTIKVEGEFSQELRVLIGHAEVKTEIRFATGKTARAA